MKTDLYKWQNNNEMRASDIIESIKNGGLESIQTMQPRNNSKADYYSDLEIPPFLRKSRD